MADPRDIESVSKFAGFLDLMSDPAKLADFTKSIKADIETLKELNGINRNLKAVEAMAVKVKADQEEKNAQLDFRIREFEARESEFSKTVAAVKDQLSKERSELNKLQDDVASRMEAVKAQEAAATEKARVLSEKEDQLKGQTKNLEDREAAVAAKAEALRSLLG